MPRTRRAWTEDDLAKLKSMAGRVATEQIAAELGRTQAALAHVACKLGISLRTRWSGAGRKALVNPKDQPIAEVINRQSNA